MTLYIISLAIYAIFLLVFFNTVSKEAPITVGDLFMLGMLLVIGFIPAINVIVALGTAVLVYGAKFVWWFDNWGGWDKVVWDRRKKD